MKISTLISMLNAVTEECGDLKVLLQIQEFSESSDQKIWISAYLSGVEMTGLSDLILTATGDTERSI